MSNFGLGSIDDGVSTCEESSGGIKRSRMDGLKSEEEENAQQDFLGDGGAGGAGGKSIGEEISDGGTWKRLKEDMPDANDEDCLVMSSEDVSDDEYGSGSEEDLQDLLIFSPEEGQKGVLNSKLEFPSEKEMSREDRLLKLNNEIIKLRSTMEAKNEEVNVYERMITLKTQIKLIFLRQENQPLTETQEKLVSDYENELTQLDQRSRDIAQENYKDMYWRQIFEERLSQPIDEKENEARVSTSLLVGAQPYNKHRAMKSVMEVCNDVKRDAGMKKECEDTGMLMGPPAPPQSKSSETATFSAKMNSGMLVNDSENPSGSKPNAAMNTGPAKTNFVNRIMCMRPTDTLRALKDRFLSPSCDRRPQ